jgi:hypothetical protein
MKTYSNQVRFAALAAFAHLLLFDIQTAHAREGMWTPEQLPDVVKDLQAAGLKLPVKSLADLETGPLASVINLNGCTASFVSSDGLLITNHHCAVRAIQHNSTRDKNLFEAGFTAKSRAEELSAGPGARVRVTLRQTDVTAKFDSAVAKTTSYAEAHAAVDALQKSLVAECEKDERLRCRVAAYDGGARYVLIAQLDIRDVRLVHAPPRSIGVFGGDEDNWMWPRHTGDWTLFRAWVGPDGAPTEYSDKNVPFQPKKWLEVNPSGVEAGSFVMVAGYPGRTYRWRTAGELAHRGEHYYPQTVDRLSRLLALIESEQKRSSEAKVKLTSMRGWIANGTKYMQGLLDGFRSSGVIPRRQKTEERMKAWVQADAKRVQRYSAGLESLDKELAAHRITEERDGVLGWLRRLPVAMRAASELHWLAYQRQFADSQRQQGYQNRDISTIRARLRQSSKAWHPASDAAIMEFMLREADKLSKASRIKPLDDFVKQHGGIKKTVEWLYSSVQLHLPETQSALVTADLATIEKTADRFVELVKVLHPLRITAYEKQKNFKGAMARLRPVYMAALRAEAGTQLYSDANSTLRVTFAQVQGYSPREAIQYDPFTTLRGILEKHTGVEPFDVSAEQQQAIRALHSTPSEKPWVRNGTVPVNFLSDCDTTGGNSGSPTLDANGQLVGLLFDGNYEAMSSDWVFDREKTRSIHVDIRYVLWALDDVFGAKHILKEMGVE